MKKKVPNNGKSVLSKVQYDKFILFSRPLHFVRVMVGNQVRKHSLILSRNTCEY
jgi:hypothetical protein